MRKEAGIIAETEKVTSKLSNRSSIYFNCGCNWRNLSFQELENSPLLDQRLSEQYSLLKCYSQIVSGALVLKANAVNMQDTTYLYIQSIWLQHQKNPYV